MKKRILFFVLLVSNIFLFAQNNNEADLDKVIQIMVPKEIYIADKGLVQYTFKTPIDLFAMTSQEYIFGEEMRIPVEKLSFLVDQNECSLEKVLILRNGLSYNLCITFVPWKTGEIKFSEFDLVKLCIELNPNDEVDEYAQSTTYPIRIEPIKISSLSEKLNIVNIKAPYPPLLIPGTTYVIWSIIILVLVFIVLIAIFIIRLQFFLNKYRILKMHIDYKKNSIRTRRRLKALLKNKNKSDDKTFCYNWQKLMREYLEYRFKVSFSSVSKNKMHSLIFSVSDFVFTEEEESALDKLSRLFVRTDYIRFAQGSIDSQLLPVEEHRAELLDNERKTIVEETYSIINIFESMFKRCEIKEDIKK